MIPGYDRNHIDAIFHAEEDYRALVYERVDSRRITLASQKTR